MLRGMNRKPRALGSRSFSSETMPQPRIRRGIFRLPPDAAHHVRNGNPFVYRDSLGQRIIQERSGDPVELLDAEGNFLGHGLYDAESNIAIRVLTRNPKESIDAGLLLRRVQGAKQLRDEWLAAQMPVTAHRVVHNEGDFLPGLTVDRYDTHLLIHQFTSSWTPYLDTFYEALEQTWAPEGIYLQRRIRSQTGEGMKEPAELVRGKRAPLEIEVQEGPLRFYVDVTAPLGTGLFPDLRNGRQLIASRSQGKRVLNAFSYAGAISVYAAFGGARKVTSIDIAAKAHARARRNLLLNQLSEENHEFVTGDVFTVLTKMREQKQLFDVIVLDPPAFSQIHGRVFSVQQDYARLVGLALGVLSPNGLLYACSNTLRFSRFEMEGALGEGAAQARRTLRIIEQANLPPDFPVPAGFPEGHYLKCYGCVAE